MRLGLCLCFCIGVARAADFTLSGECPKVKVQENLDYTKFSGTWYTVGSYASDGRATYDCSSLDIQEDNIGFTLRETYVDVDQGNRTQKSYSARIDPTFDAGNSAKFIFSREDNDKVLQFPFVLLSTDYDKYAIGYTCKTLKNKIRSHYVFTWILSRSRDKFDGQSLIDVETALSKYAELAENRKSFVFKDFSESTCGFTNKMETDYFTNNFW